MDCDDVMVMVAFKGDVQQGMEVVVVVVVVVVAVVAAAVVCSKAKGNSGLSFAST